MYLLAHAKWTSATAPGDATMQFHIHGADSNTGADRLVTLDAPNAQEAERQALAMGMLISSVYPAQAAVAPSAVPMPGGTARLWTVHDRGSQYGPHTEHEIGMLLAAGTISPQALVWKLGAPRWLPVTSIVPLLPRPTPPSSGGTGFQMPGIATPLLVSAIGNIVVGLLWASTCFGIVFTIPMAVLCVMEFSLYAEVEKLPKSEVARRATGIAWFEIIVGLFNLVSLVCGIVLLVNISKLRSRTP